MARAVRWIVLAMLVAVLFVPTFVHLGSGGDDAEGTEPTTITRYNAVFEVADDGDMEVTETLIVDVPTDDRHGIFRFFDTRDPQDDRAVRVPRRVTVMRDGRPERWTRDSEQVGRHEVVRIGREDITLDPGEHTYVLRYVMEDVLLDDGSDGSAFHWDLVPGGWRQPIDRAELTVSLPHEPTGEVRCAEGAGGDDGSCSAVVDGSTVTVRVKDLPPRTPVTVRAEMAAPAPEAASRLPWPVWFAPVLGTRAWLLGAVVVGALWAGWLGRRIAAATYEEEPDFPLQHAPPSDVGPAQAAYVFTERMERSGFVANLMHAAERGVVTLEHGDGSWTVTRTSAGDPALDSSTRATVDALVPTPGASFTAGRDDAEAGEQLRSAVAATDAETKAWATREGHLSKAGWGSWAGVGVVAALVLYVALVLALSSTMTAVALVPAAFLAMTLPVLRPGATTKRTAKGRHLWSRVGGFRRALSVPSDGSSGGAGFDVESRPELFASHLPWAVALGCADAWEETYRAEAGHLPPLPLTLTGATVGAVTARSMVADLDSTVTSAIASYDAAQASSSSGAGFTGGSGGGGGGGGSW